MSISILYWLLMILWLFFGCWSNWPNFRAGAPNLLLFVLLVILGWHAFGAPIH
jgi:hypothetical protein